MFIPLTPKCGTDQYFLVYLAASFISVYLWYERGIKALCRLDNRVGQFFFDHAPILTMFYDTSGEIFSTRPYLYREHRTSGFITLRKRRFWCKNILENITLSHILVYFWCIWNELS